MSTISRSRPSRGDARQVRPNFLADALDGMTGLAVLFENTGAASRITTTTGNIGVPCKDFSAIRRNGRSQNGLDAAAQ